MERSWLRRRLPAISHRVGSIVDCIPIPLALVLLLVAVSFSSIESGVSALIVEVEVDRPPPRGFFRGPKWVSLNSMTNQQEDSDYSRKTYSWSGSKT